MYVFHDFCKHYLSILFFFFFFNDTATTEIYTLSLHDALPISTERRSLIGATVQPYVRKWSSISRPSIAPLVAVRPSPPAPTVRLRTVHRSAADDLKPCVREADAADADRAWSETRRRET